jgi:hypothetical protein
MSWSIKDLGNAGLTLAILTIDILPAYPSPFLLSVSSQVPLVESNLFSGEAPNKLPMPYQFELIAGYIFVPILALLFTEGLRKIGRTVVPSPRNPLKKIVSRISIFFLSIALVTWFFSWQISNTIIINTPYHQPTLYEVAMISLIPLLPTFNAALVVSTVVGIGLGYYAMLEWNKRAKAYRPS